MVSKGGVAAKPAPTSPSKPQAQPKLAPTASTERIPLEKEPSKSDLSAELREADDAPKAPKRAEPSTRQVSALSAKRAEEVLTQSRPSEATEEAPKASPALPAELVEAPLDLSEVEAFSDLPEDARETFALAARTVRLTAGEEVAGFALAYVVSGEVDVSAAMVDAMASHLTTGGVLRARGTPTESVPLRLLCTTPEGCVAVWTDDAVEEAFRSCPWVEDDLRTASDQVQTLAGVTMGSLGNRLDATLRDLVTSRLTARSLLEGEVMVEAGAAVPGLVVVGVGKLQLLDKDVLVHEMRSGEFLFPEQVLGAGPAPYTARAGVGGALVMVGDRRTAQELMVTVPPLLEILAGM